MGILSDDLMSANSVIAKLGQDMQTTKWLTEPSYLDVIEQLKHTIEPFHIQQIEFKRALAASGVAAAIEEIVNANQHWHEVIHQTTASNRIAERLHTAHESWLLQSNILQQEVSRHFQLQASVKLALGDSFLQLIAAERLMTGIDFEVLGSRLQLKMPEILDMESSIA